MELPYAKHREKYIELILELEEDLKSATNNSEATDLTLHTIQQKLDAVASKYQDDDKIGSARYKLYELQAFVHYFNHDDDKAFDFINTAMDIKGSSYEKAEKFKNTLISEISDDTPLGASESKMTKAEKRKKFVGLEGWLAFFIVGQILTLLYTVFRFFSDGFWSSSDTDMMNELQSGAGDTMQTLASLENVLIVVYIILLLTALVLLFQKSRAAKIFAIATLAFAAVYGIADYIIASAIYDSIGLSQNAEIQTYMSKYAGDVGRSIVAALIWIPYFLVSKRVKATLTKG